MPFSTNRRDMLTSVAGLGAAVGLAGCAGGTVVGLDKRARTLDIANGGEPLSLDPHKRASAAESNIIGDMFVGLTTENERGEPAPGMAERWETTDDGLTWTFYLRRAVWSDGARCDAHDFEFAFRRVLDPRLRAPQAPLLFPIKNAEKVKSGALAPNALGANALGDLVLELQLEHPAPELPQILKHCAAYPAPKHLIERLGDEWVKPEHIVVNGPFTLATWWSNTIIHLRKNPRFWEADQVAFEHLYFYPAAGAAAAQSVLAGGRGWCVDAPSSLIADLRRRAPAYLRVAPALRTRGFLFNCTRPPFDDARVRVALAMAVDRESMARRFYPAGDAPAYALIPPGVADYPGGARYGFASLPLDQRRLEACALLAEAGYGPERPLHVAFAHCAPEESPGAAAAIAADWRALASWVSADLAPAAPDVHAARLKARAFEAGEAEWLADLNDARPYLLPFESGGGGWNQCGYANPQFDALTAESDLAVDVNARATVMSAAEQLLLDEAPLCTTVFSVSKSLVHPDLGGYADNIENIHRARWFWIKNPSL